MVTAAADISGRHRGSVLNWNLLSTLEILAQPFTVSFIQDHEAGTAAAFALHHLLSGRSPLWNGLPSVKTHAVVPHLDCFKISVGSSEYFRPVL